MMNDVITAQPKTYRRWALGMTALSMVVVYILWNVPAFDIVMYPLRLFVTYVHEAGHSLAALVTGGQVIGFLVSPDGSGLATTAGGNRIIILMAGYLGAAAFGSLLFYAVNRFPRYSKIISMAVGVGMLIFTVLFAVPDDQTGIPVALLIGVGFSLLLFGTGARFNILTNMLLLNVLAVSTALNAVLDVWYLIQFSDASRGVVRNDAAALSEQLGGLLPPAAVATLWAIAAVVMLGAAIWYGVIKQLKREVDETFDEFENRQRFGKA